MNDNHSGLQAAVYVLGLVVGCLIAAAIRSAIG